MQFKPQARKDDKERIRSDIAHDVKVGGKGAVSSHDTPESMTKALPATPPHRAMYAGDQVYFQGADGQAQHGTVAAVGKHGATIDVQDGEGKTTEHQVHHHHIIGHRKRAERKLVIIDRGEDGSIAVDESGKRVFLRGDLGETKDESPELTKSLSGTVETADDARIIATVNAALFHF